MGVINGLKKCGNPINLIESDTAALQDRHLAFFLFLYWFGVSRAMLFRVQYILLCLFFVVCSALAEPIQQSFQDWQVTCNNQNFCQARNTGRHQGLVMTLSRSPGARTDVTLRIDLGNIDNAISNPVILASGMQLDGENLVLDGKWRATPHHLYTDDARTITGLLEKIQPAQAITLIQGGEIISLAGLKGALRFIDAQQQRVGNETAWIKKGDQPPLKVPPAPALKAVKTTQDRPAPLTTAELNALTDYGTWRVDSHACSLDPARQEIHVSVLSSDKVLMMIDCEAGAYNVIQRAWLVSRQQPFVSRVLRLKLPFSQPDQAGTLELTNATYNEASRELTTVDKWRGIGDCGVASRWRFDGQTFRLVRYAQESQCDGWHGADAWPTLWVTK